MGIQELTTTIPPQKPDSAEYSATPPLTVDMVFDILNQECKDLNPITTSVNPDTVGQQSKLLDQAIVSWKDRRDCALLYLLNKTQSLALQNKPEMAHLYAEAGKTLLFSDESLLYPANEANNRAVYLSRSFQSGKTFGDVGYPEDSGNDPFIKDALVIALCYCTQPKNPKVIDVFTKALTILQDPQRQMYHAEVQQFLANRDVTQNQLFAFISRVNDTMSQLYPDEQNVIDTELRAATIRNRNSMLLLRFLYTLSIMPHSGSTESQAIQKICRELAKKPLLSRTYPGDNEPTSCQSWLYELSDLYTNLEFLEEHQSEQPQAIRAIQAMGIAYAYNIARGFAPPIKPPWKGSYQDEINRYWQYIDPWYETAPTDPKTLWKLFEDKLETISLDAMNV